MEVSALITFPMVTTLKELLIAAWKPCYGKDPLCIHRFPSFSFLLSQLSHSLSPPSSCGLRDPSWTEIRHFVTFLDIQLQSCEESVFCDEALVGDVMAGLKGFVVKFMIRMSQVCD